MVVQFSSKLETKTTTQRVKGEARQAKTDVINSSSNLRKSGNLPDLRFALIKLLRWP